MNLALATVPELTAFDSESYPQCEGALAFRRGRKSNCKL